MTQKTKSITQPSWLEADDTPRRSTVSSSPSQYPSNPADESLNPNVVLSFNVDNQVWTRHARAAASGAMRNRQTGNQRPLVADEKHGSLGFVKDVGGSTTFQGTAIKGRIDTVEDGGKDPVSPKVPRKSYVTGISHSGTADVDVGVSADSWQTITVDSGTVQLEQNLEPEKVWWGGNKNIEGTRLAYRLEHEDSNNLTIESFINEHRVRGRR